MPLNPDQVKSKSLHLDRTADFNLLDYGWYFGETLKAKDGVSGSREVIYHIILDAFKSGSIARFRACPHCKAFFVAEDARQQFCSDEHRNEFNNEQRLKSGYFTTLRHKVRTLDLKKARALKREGKSSSRNPKTNGTITASSEAGGNSTLEPHYAVR